MTKSELRKYYLSLRLGMTEEEVLKKSLLIAGHLFSWALYQNAKTLHTYVSSRSKREIDTFHVIDNALQAGKRVAVPKMMAGSRLKHCSLPSIDSLRTNQWDIPEPVDTPEIDTSEIDLILVPMAVTDLRCNRIGYGKGYYDRFLGETAAVKVGLILDSQIHTHILPVEEHDIPMDFVISESGFKEGDLKLF